MLAALALALLAPSTILTPTDDVWVYPHASDPQKDPFLRVWGVGGASVVPGSGDVSYSYLKFDLAALPAGKLKKATLVVYQIADPAWTLETAKQVPLEVRSMPSTFTEKTWVYDDVAKIAPVAGKEGLLGTGGVVGLTAGQRVEIRFDLTEKIAEFEKSRGGPLALALTSQIDPSEEGQKAVYKLYSKDAETAANRPRLEFETE